MTDDLIKRLEMKASVMEMGEKIAWGSDTAIMREAAARIRELEAAQTSSFTESFKATVARYDDLPDGHKTDYERSHAPAPVTVSEAAQVLLAEWDDHGDGLLGELCCYSLDEDGMISPDVDGDWVPFSNVRAALRALAGQGGE